MGCTAGRGQALTALAGSGKLNPPFSIRTLPMQRDPNLVRLSHEHQSGLLLAKRSRGLFPAFRVAGQDALVERTLREYAELRALICGQAPDDSVRFGDALSAHIRFEERTLFETAQQVLEPAVLV